MVIGTSIVSSTLTSSQTDELIKAAIAARSRAYAVYSNFKVGAALLTQDDEIITGCNIENVSFTPTICAERVAVFKAISEGKYNFRAIAVVSTDTTPTPPCGVCRQVLGEFVDGNFEFILASSSGRILRHSLDDIFPMRFIPQQDIGKRNVWENLQSEITEAGSFTEEEYKRITRFLRNEETFKHQMTIFVQEGQVTEREKEKLIKLRSQVYNSAVGKSEFSGIMTTDDFKILRHVIELIDANNAH